MVYKRTIAYQCMNIALILAGGKGLRAGESIPKQFIEVNKKPVIIYTLEKFQKCSLIDEIYISCVDGWEKRLSQYVLKYDINKVVKIVQGGKTGLDSVLNGLNAMCSAKDKDLILIHDAVRPFVDIESIEDNIKIASKHGVAVTAVDLVETLVYSEDGIYSEKIIPRDNLKRILTPQTFTYDVLKEIYGRGELDANATPSTFSLYMKYGLPVYCSRGSEKNVKLTYPEDIQYFRKMFE